MGVFYDVRVHLGENSDDFVGKKGTTVNMGIRKAQYAGLDVKQRSPTATTGLTCVEEINPPAKIIEIFFQKKASCSDQGRCR